MLFWNTYSSLRRGRYGSAFAISQAPVFSALFLPIERTCSWCVPWASPRVISLTPSMPSPQLLISKVWRLLGAERKWDKAFAPKGLTALLLMSSYMMLMQRRPTAISMMESGISSLSLPTKMSLMSSTDSPFAPESRGLNSCQKRLEQELPLRASVWRAGSASLSVSPATSGSSRESTLSCLDSIANFIYHYRDIQTMALRVLLWMLVSSSRIWRSLRSFISEMLHFYSYFRRIITFYSAAIFFSLFSVYISFRLCQSAARRARLSFLFYRPLCARERSLKRFFSLNYRVYGCGLTFSITQQLLILQFCFSIRAIILRILSPVLLQFLQRLVASGRSMAGFYLLRMRAYFRNIPTTFSGASLISLNAFLIDLKALNCYRLLLAASRFLAMCQTISFSSRICWSSICSFRIALAAMTNFFYSSSFLRRSIGTRLQMDPDFPSRQRRRQRSNYLIITTQLEATAYFQASWWFQSSPSSIKNLPSPILTTRSFISSQLSWSLRVCEPQLDLLSSFETLRQETRSTQPRSMKCNLSIVDPLRTMVWWIRQVWTLLKRQRQCTAASSISLKNQQFLSRARSNSRPQTLPVNSFLNCSPRMLRPTQSQPTITSSKSMRLQRFYTCPTINPRGSQAVSDRNFYFALIITVPLSTTFTKQHRLFAFVSAPQGTPSQSCARDINVSQLHSGRLGSSFLSQRFI